MQLTREGPGKYRLYVAASNVNDLVTVAGGWLADRAMAGWEVKGYVAGSDDHLPLQALGIAAENIDLSLNQWDPNALQELAFMPDLYQRDKRLRARVRQVIARKRVEVIALGANLGDVPREPATMEYRCSGAALAFKKAALVIAGQQSDSVIDRENFRRWPVTRKPVFDQTDWQTRRHRHQVADLVPVLEPRISAPPA